MVDQTQQQIEQAKQDISSKRQQISEQRALIQRTQQELFNPLKRAGFTPRNVRIQREQYVKGELEPAKQKLSEYEKEIGTYEKDINKTQSEYNAYLAAVREQQLERDAAESAYKLFERGYSSAFLKGTREYKYLRQYEKELKDNVKDLKQLNPELYKNIPDSVDYKSLTNYQNKIKPIIDSINESERKRIELLLKSGYQGKSTKEGIIFEKIPTVQTISRGSFELPRAREATVRNFDQKALDILNKAYSGLKPELRKDIYNIYSKLSPIASKFYYTNAYTSVPITNEAGKIIGYTAGNKQTRIGKLAQQIEESEAFQSVYPTRQSEELLETTKGLYIALPSLATAGIGAGATTGATQLPKLFNPLVQLAKTQLPRYGARLAIGSLLTPIVSKALEKGRAKLPEGRIGDVGYSLGVGLVAGAAPTLVGIPLALGFSRRLIASPSQTVIEIASNPLDLLIGITGAKIGSKGRNFLVGNKEVPLPPGIRREKVGEFIIEYTKKEKAISEAKRLGQPILIGEQPLGLVSLEQTTKLPPQYASVSSRLGNLLFSPGQKLISEARDFKQKAAVIAVDIGKEQVPFFGITADLTRRGKRLGFTTGLIEKAVLPIEQRKAIIQDYRNILNTLKYDNKGRALLNVDGVLFVVRKANKKISFLNANNIPKSELSALYQLYGETGFLPTSQVYLSRAYQQKLAKLSKKDLADYMKGFLAPGKFASKVKPSKPSISSGAEVKVRDIVRTPEYSLYESLVGVKPIRSNKFKTTVGGSKVRVLTKVKKPVTVGGINDVTRLLTGNGKKVKTQTVQQPELITKALQAQAQANKAANKVIANMAKNIPRPKTTTITKSKKPSLAAGLATVLIGTAATKVKASQQSKSTQVQSNPLAYGEKFALSPMQIMGNANIQRTRQEQSPIEKLREGLVQVPAQKQTQIQNQQFKVKQASARTIPIKTYNPLSGVPPLIPPQPRKKKGRRVIAKLPQPKNKRSYQLAPTLTQNLYKLPRGKKPLYALTGFEFSR